MMTAPRDEDDLGKALGRVIANHRHRSQLSQEALGAKAGVHLTYISQLERGLKSPTVRILTDIGRAIGMRGSDLLRLAEEEMRNPSLVAFGRSKRAHIPRG